MASIPTETPQGAVRAVSKPPRQANAHAVPLPWRSNATRSRTFRARRRAALAAALLLVLAVEGRADRAPASPSAELAGRANAPAPRSQVVSFEPIGEFFPADTPVVSAAERRASIARRREHVARRFRR